MNTIIKYLQFPFTFSPEELVSELNGLNEKWVMHFNQAHYEGEWSALPLRSVNGGLTNVIPSNSKGDVFSDTVLMEQCPYIKSILAYFPCEHKATRFLKLKPGAVIKEHTDADLSYELGEARIHIPIITNPQVEFYLDNERVDMLPGTCWYMNFNLPHRINNFGNTDRVHLVIDIIVNGHIREIFENVSPGKKKIIPAKEKYSADDKLKIIEHLKGMNTDASNKLAMEMEAGLG
jgi:hypothetical protein